MEFKKFSTDISSFEITKSGATEEPQVVLLNRMSRDNQESYNADLSETEIQQDTLLFQTKNALDKIIDDKTHE